MPKDTFNFNYNSIFIISKDLLKTSWLRITEVKLQMLSNCLTLQSCNCTFRNPLFQKKSVKGNYPWKESSGSEEDTSKIGNTLWCSCGKYKTMATYAESICWLDKYEIRESYFKWKLFQRYSFFKYFKQ